MAAHLAVRGEFIAQSTVERYLFPAQRFTVTTYQWSKGSFKFWITEIRAEGSKTVIARRIRISEKGRLKGHYDAMRRLQRKGSVDLVDRGPEIDQLLAD